MATKIRLARSGAKKRPFYRVVVADVRAPRDGKFIEKVGIYNPLLSKEDPNRVVLKTERIQHWISTGAQPTDRVAKFLEAAGIAIPFKKAAKTAPAAPKEKKKKSA